MNIIDYLRIAVTDRCNLRCVYCMPARGVKLKSHYEILSIEEIEKLVKSVVSIGIKKIRLTGGEPLVRKNIEILVKKIAAIEGIDHITMTTNGTLLGSMAKNLKASGLNRVNISLDTLNSDKFKRITRYGNINNVLAGIDASLDAGLTPVKINVVVIKNFNDDEIIDFVDFAIKKGVQFRFIELMPIGESDEKARIEHISNDIIKAIIKKKYKLIYTDDINTDGPASNYFIEGHPSSSIGFISAISNNFCSRCNRLRVTADGKVRLCLYKDLEFDILALLREGRSEAEIAAFFKSIIPLKPKSHSMKEEGWGNQKRKMFQIGG